MTSIDSQILSIEGDTKNANQIKDLVLQRLMRDGIISEDHANLYAANWQVIIIKTSWFDRWCEAFKISKSGYKYKYVRFED